MTKQRLQYNTFQAELKSVSNTEKGTLIKGYASTTTKDRYDDIVEPEAFRKSITRNYKNNPIILFQHKQERPIGRATVMSIRPDGLYIEAQINDNEIEPKIKAGILGTFSIGYIPKQIEYRDKNGYVLDPKADAERIYFEEGVTRHIKELDLAEISVVSVPANPDSLFTLQKSLKASFQEEKEAYLKANNLTMNNKEENLLEVKEAEEAPKEKEIVEESETAETLEESKASEETVETPTEDETNPEEEVDEKSGKEVEAEDEGVKEEVNTEEKSAFLNKDLVTEEKMIELAQLAAEYKKRAEDAELKLSKIPQKQALLFSAEAQSSSNGELKEAKGFKKMLMNSVV